jgi:hypothetical protein
MRGFLKRLRASWLYLRHYPVVTLPPDYWTSADAKALSNFMTGDTGSKLRHMRFNRVYESQQMAITDRKDSAYSAGVAFGILALTSEEDALLRVELPQPEIREEDAAFRSINR